MSDGERMGMKKVVDVLLLLAIIFLACMLALGIARISGAA